MVWYIDAGKFVNTFLLVCKIINKLYAYVSYLFTYLFIPSCTTLLSTLCTTISLQLFDLSAHPLLVYSFLRLVYFSAPTLVILWYYMITAFYLFCYSLLVYFLFMAILSHYYYYYYIFPLNPLWFNMWSSALNLCMLHCLFILCIKEL